MSELRGKQPRRQPSVQSRLVLFRIGDDAAGGPLLRPGLVTAWLKGFGANLYVVLEPGDRPAAGANCRKDGFVASARHGRQIGMFRHVDEED